MGLQVPILRTVYPQIKQGPSPRQILYSAGPRVQVVIGQAPPPADASGAAPPEPAVPDRTVTALLDTGATQCCITDQLAQELQLQVIDRRMVGGAAGQNEHNVYLGRIAIPALGIEIRGRLIGVTMEPQMPVILGRDFLSMVVLIYDGMTGSFTICR